MVKTAEAQNGGGESRAVFPSTAWTLIIEAQRSSANQAGEALGKVLTRYWKPIYAYYRSRGMTRDESADLVQDFFYRFVKTQKILKVERSEKRFRDWLLVCARHFVLDHWRREKAVKRRPVEGIISLEALHGSDGEIYEPAANEDPSKAYNEAWRHDLLDRAFSIVAPECERKQRMQEYQIFLDYYCNTAPSQPTWQEIAAKYSLPSWKDASRKADWVKVKLSQAIRTEVARYVECEEEIDDEIRDLFRS